MLILTTSIILAATLYAAFLFLPQWDSWLSRTKRASHGYGKICCLTFDDGPSEWTPQILDILKEHDIKATFFVTGERAGKYPGMVKRAADDGHTIGNHTMTHRKLTFCSKTSASSEIAGCSKVLESITGHAPSLFRAPHGFKRPGLKKMLSKMDLQLVPWTKGIWDTDMPPPRTLVERVKRRMRPLEILLLHDGIDNRPIPQHRRSTVEALPGIIDEYRKRGYKFMTVNELTNNHPSPTPPYKGGDI